MALYFKKNSFLWIFASLFLFTSIYLFSTQNEQSDSFESTILVENVRAHQRVFQDIANAHKGNRMVITPGYTASVAYVQNKLQEAGYQTRLQDFQIPFNEDKTPPQFVNKLPHEKVFVPGVDFFNMTGAGSAEITAQLEAVDLKIPSLKPNDSTSGCERADFAQFKKGNIALIQRGTCAFQVKARNAIAAGAAGIIIFNEGNPGRTESFESRLSATFIDFPALTASFLVGESLYNGVLNGPTGNEVFIKVDVGIVYHTVQNLIAETAEGDAARAVVVGAHLDGVAEGPGINDNGSGSAATLEIALKFAKSGITPRNKLRFMWFAGEELGLLGSTFYVNSLSSEEKGNILAMLNFDMLGSSNYVRFVYDGDNSSALSEMSQAGPQGSGYIEQIFLNYFAHLQQASEPTDFNGRSDYGPFIRAGIPAGGLFSGAEGRKSVHLAQIYGGIAGAPFDPCYHQSCDDFEHTGASAGYELALKSLKELSKAAAFAVMHLAATPDAIRLPQEQAHEEGTKIELEYEGNYLVK